MIRIKKDNFINNYKYKLYNTKLNLIYPIQLV